MRMPNLRKNILAAATGAALAMGLVSQASASPVFTIDPNAIPGNVFATSQFNADFMSGTTSELLTLNPGPNTVTGSGWVQFTSFSLGAATVPSLTSGLGGDQASANAQIKWTKWTAKFPPDPKAGE